jgi:transcriptional regulator with XRE-family HTH domain
VALRRQRQMCIRDRFQISRASVSSWESGVNQPDSRKLEKLAMFLNTTVEFLVTGQSRSATEQSPSNIKDVPFVEWDKIGDSNLKNLDGLECVPLLYASNAKRLFATRLVNSQSLDWVPGQIPAGAILVVDPDKKTAHGCIVLVLKSNGVPALAQVIDSKDGLIFSGLNERQIFKLSARTRCLGVVVEWRISEKL